MLETLNMGGHAFFVWSAYSIAFGLAFILYKSSAKQLKKAEKEVADLGLVVSKAKVEEVPFEKQSA